MEDVLLPSSGQSPGEVDFLGFWNLARDVAIRIVPEFPVVGEKLPCQPVIDKEIND